MSSNQQARQDQAGEAHFRPLKIPPTVFPVKVTLPHGGEFTSYGMLLRDYFVAHAPAAPAWFKPAMDSQRPPNHGPRASIERWDEAFERQRTLQWPGYWADQQLALRDAWAKKGAAE